jgi:hypothetical protein
VSPAERPADEQRTGEPDEGRGALDGSPLARRGVDEAEVLLRIPSVDVDGPALALALGDLEASGIEVSTLYVADDVRTDCRGMMIALPPNRWLEFDAQSLAALASKTMAATRPSHGMPESSTFEWGPSVASVTTPRTTS